MLDQIAVGVPLCDVISDTEINDHNTGDFFLWCNDYFIEGWMCELFDSRVAKGSDCSLEHYEYVRLHWKDLERLEQDIQQIKESHTDWYKMDYYLLKKQN